MYWQVECMNRKGEVMIVDTRLKSTIAASIAQTLQLRHGRKGYVYSAVLDTVNNKKVGV